VRLSCSSCGTPRSIEWRFQAKQIQVVAIPRSSGQPAGALDERFHHKGGMRYLYQLLPGGPVAQECRLAGLKAPAGAVDKGFGSVA
jgi:hypothetical protein